MTDNQTQLLRKIEEGAARLTPEDQTLVAEAIEQMEAGTFDEAVFWRHVAEVRATR